MKLNPEIQLHAEYVVAALCTLKDYKTGGV